MPTNYYILIVALIAVPLLIFAFSKNVTVKENKRYAELRKSLERKHLQKIWKAFEATDVIPFPENFDENLKIPMFYDKRGSKVYAFEIEELLEGSKKIPKSHQELVNQFNTSKLVSMGWRTCNTKDGQEFLDRLAQLDDELDFEVTSGDASISNKIAFDLTFFTVNEEDGSIERAYKLDDGNVQPLDVTAMRYGTLNAVIDVADFLKIYDTTNSLSVASKRIKLV